MLRQMPPVCTACTKDYFVRGHRKAEYLLLPTRKASVERLTGAKRFRVAGQLVGSAGGTVAGIGKGGQQQQACVLRLGFSGRQLCVVETQALAVAPGRNT